MQFCDLWVIEEGAMNQMRALSASITPDGFKAAREGLESVRETGAASRRDKSVAILPIHGALEARASLMGQLFGMTSTEAVGNTFSRLMADESVSAVVMDIASPGGMVYGVPELAAKIHAARGIKPIIAVANPMAASGGYWIAAAADRVVVSPSADVGSVGVIVSRFENVAQMEREGVKEHVIRSAGSPYKGEFVESEPLTDEGRQHLQLRADQIYDQFAGDLAKFRGVSVQHVRDNFGKGRLVDSKKAIQAGMADRVMTLEETVYKLAAGRIRIAREAAQDDWNMPTPTEKRRMRLQEVAGALKAEVN
jgi:signal peptide peptidase SppA